MSLQYSVRNIAMEQNVFAIILKLFDVFTLFHTVSGALLKHLVPYNTP